MVIIIRNFLKPKIIISFIFKKLTNVLKVNQKNTNHVLNNGQFKYMNHWVFEGWNVFGEFEMFFVACVFECIFLVQFMSCFYIFWNVHIIIIFKNEWKCKINV
jgi:hypothetical protein